MSLVTANGIQIGSAAALLKDRDLSKYDALSSPDGGFFLVP
jgi:hypothetical protein